MKEQVADRIQAPTLPTRRRTTLHALSSKPSTSGPPKREGSKTHGLLGITSKKDKRIIKHSALLSRIQKPKATPKKRRRPSKKLVTNLELLADALPVASNTKSEEAIVGDAKIRHRSLKSRPGAQKRKEKQAVVEKDRFNKNMAQMMAPAPSQLSPPTAGSEEYRSASRNKWAALRGFIQHTMEQRPEAGT